MLQLVNNLQLKYFFN